LKKELTLFMMDLKKQGQKEEKNSGMQGENI